MEMDMRRLNLRAALLKLTEGESVPENVRICCESMASIFAEVDDIRHIERWSKGTDWAREALERVNLVKLGNFTVQITTKRRRRTITFTDGDVAIEFIFNHTPRKAVDRLMPVLERAKGQSDAGQRTVADAFLQSVVQESFLGKSKSPEELLLGGKPLALDEYRLQCVRRVGPLVVLFKILPFRKRTILYVEG